MTSHWSRDMDNAANTGAYMGLISWIILGLIAGFIGSKIVNKTGDGLILDVILGVVGAVLGGYLFNLFGAQGVRAEFMESARSSDWSNCRPYDL
jgi:uncharacterized membrane protein YeaQ/YmgE (transglycosylase-associated protein family)